ncbi:MAG: SpoIIIAH-like family protein [Clostridia bacterium]|nr:SpoIIIAH-like family protein [Clostridia bacterium]
MNRPQFKLTSKGMLALVILSALLILAIIVNVSLKNKQQSALNEKTEDADHSEEQPIGGDKAVSARVYEDYFAGFRNERSELRAKEIEYLRRLINDSGTDAETLQTAQVRLIELVENMEREFSIESMIRSKGFLDAAVTFRNDSVSVVINGDSLTDEEVARILDIVRTETGAPASRIRISLSGTV